MADPKCTCSVDLCDPNCDSVDPRCPQHGGLTEIEKLRAELALQREVFIRVMIRMMTPLVAPGGGFGPVSVELAIRELEEQVRAELAQAIGVRT